MNKALVKNILAGFGAVFLVILLAIGIFYLRWMMLNRGAQSFATDSVTAISAEWSFEELKSRADERMLNLPEEQLKAVFTKLPTLGKLKSTPVCVGDTALHFGTTGPALSGKYDCTSEFEKDTAIISLSILGDYGNNWKIAGINVASDYLVRNKE